MSCKALDIFSAAFNKDRGLIKFALAFYILCWCVLDKDSCIQNTINYLAYSAFGLIYSHSVALYTYCIANIYTKKTGKPF